MAVNNINNLSNNRLQNTASNQGVGSKSIASSQDSKASAARLDSVSLTNEAQQLQKMQQNLNAASTGNEDKVERLKKAVASGEYQINNEAVARKMFSFETDLDKKLG